MIQRRFVLETESAGCGIITPWEILPGDGMPQGVVRG